MQTDSLALFEFFVEIVCSAADQTPVVNARYSDNDDSFFSNVEDNMVQSTSMHDLLQGHDNLLKTFAENWKKEIHKPWQMIIQIDDFLIENKAYFERPKMKVRTIMDYVYTVV